MTGSLPDDDVVVRAEETRASSEAVDPVLLVAEIAESLPGLDAGELERLADALDELTEAVGLRMAVDAEEGR